MAANLSRRNLGLLLAEIGFGLMAGIGRAGAADASDITAPVEALDQALVAAMKEGRDKPFRDRYELLAPRVEAAFDLPVILKVSVGPRWSSLPPGTQAELLQVFRRFTIASYVANFDSYNGETFQVLPDLRSMGGNQIVQTHIVNGDGRTVRLDYVMRQLADGWKAVDVLMDGTISRVAVQRSDFRGLLGQGDAAELIARLQRKVADLSGGALAS